MQWAIAPALMILALAGCGGEPAPKAETPQLPEPSGPPAPKEVREEPAPAIRPGLSWESSTGGAGTALRLMGAQGELVMSIACLPAPSRLAVNVPGFKPVGSEDRFALGLGEEPITLVADPGAQQRPGVTAEGPAPENLESLLSGANSVSANYGSQTLGPYIPPQPELAEALAKACKAG